MSQNTLQETSFMSKDSSRQTTLNEEQRKLISQVVTKHFTEAISVKEKEILEVKKQISKAKLLLIRNRYYMLSSLFQKREIDARHQSLLQYQRNGTDMSIKMPKPSRKCWDKTFSEEEGSQCQDDTVSKGEGSQIVTQAVSKEEESQFSDMIALMNERSQSCDMTSSTKEGSQTLADSLMEGFKNLSREQKEALLRSSSIPYQINDSNKENKRMIRILVGNVYQYEEDVGNEELLKFKWILYIRGPEQEPDLSEHVDSVEIVLDKSFAPCHIITLRKYPFQLFKRGWGQFKATITIHFKNRRNKSAKLKHPVTMSVPSHPNHRTWNIGLEQWYNFWISDHSTAYMDVHSRRSTKVPQSRPKRNSAVKSSQVLESSSEKENKKVLSSTGSQNRHGFTPSLKPNQTPSCSKVKTRS